MPGSAVNANDLAGIGDAPLGNGFAAPSRPTPERLVAEPK
jgi:hypothetical protein